jgi:hypothetical protein
LRPLLAISLILGGSTILFFGLLWFGNHFDALEGNVQLRRRLVIFYAAANALAALLNYGQRIVSGDHSLAPPAELTLQYESQPKLISKTEPSYLPRAKQAGIEGKVRFSAIISPTGQVVQLTLISGHPLLVPPAEEAAYQWVYSKSLSPIRTNIEVNFALDSSK